MFGDTATLLKVWFVPPELPPGLELAVSGVTVRFTSPLPLGVEECGIKGLEAIGHCVNSSCWPSWAKMGGRGESDGSDQSY